MLERCAAKPIAWSAAAVYLGRFCRCFRAAGRNDGGKHYFVCARRAFKVVLLAGAGAGGVRRDRQTVLANPLAALTSSARQFRAQGLGVALCCAVLPTAAATDCPLRAFLGSSPGVMLVLLISEKAGASRMTLVLAGVAISGNQFRAGIDAVLTVFPDSLIGFIRVSASAACSTLSMGKVAPAWVIASAWGRATACSKGWTMLGAERDGWSLEPAGARRARGATGAGGRWQARLWLAGLLQVCWGLLRRIWCGNWWGESRRLLAGCA